MNNPPNVVVKAVCEAVFCVFKGYGLYYAN